MLWDRLMFTSQELNSCDSSNGETEDKCAKTTLFLHFGGDVIRGSEICLIESINAVTDAGGKIILLCNCPATLRPELPNSIDIEYLHFPEVMFDGDYRSLPIISYLQTVWRIWKRFRHSDIQLVYANSGLPCQLGWPLSRLLGVPLLAHFHHPAPKRYFFFWLVILADCIVVPSCYTASVVRVKCGRESVVVYNGVDTNQKFISRVRDPRVRAQLGFGEEHVVIGQVGALAPHKRPDFLLEAFAAIANESPVLRLVFVGGGEMQGWLEQRSKLLGIADKVRVLGRVPDVAPYYQHIFDINVLASECEGLGISVIEASACGVPSVVSDSTGLVEVVENGVSGLHFKTESQRDLERNLLRLSHSSELRRQLGVGAAELARKKFSLRTYREGIVAQVRALGGLA